LAWVFDVADAVLHLANATWVTGVILPVDGGVDAGGDGSYHGPKERLADGTA
jgi:NAD(P)-dependent dehydrogenase (short-subunit alcohol dehydrogenase family)